MTTPNDVLRFFADLAPVGSARDEPPRWDVRSDGPIVATTLVPGVPGRQPVRVRDDAEPAEELEPGVAYALALQDGDAWRKTVVLHGEQEVGRSSRLSVVGRGRVPGGIRTVVAPLLAAVVGPGPRFGAATSPAARSPDDVGEPTALATTLGLDEELLLTAATIAPAYGPVPEPLLASMPRLRSVRDDLRRAGVGVDGVVVGGTGNAMVSHRLWLCLGDLRYVEVVRDEPPRVEALRAWSSQPTDALAATALGALYDPRGDRLPGDDPRSGPDVAVDQPRSPLPLTGAQREVVVEARSAPISVVSGAPGTGKSHVAVAVALDEVARGGAVLLATRSGHAADVLAELLDRHPGPTPVRFGGGTSRRVLADRLAEGLPPPASTTVTRAALAAEDRAAAGLRDATDVLAALLAVVDGGADATTEAVLRTDVPGAFDGSSDAAVVGEHLERASRDGGWWTRLVASRAEQRLRRAVRAAPQVPLERIREAVDLARVRRLAATLEDRGELRLEPARERVDIAAASLRAAVGRRLDVATAGAPTRRSRAAVAGLAAALRAGPARRAALLARIDSEAMTAAMPLWVGTVAEVERLLPRRPGLFDLVVLDEASQLDQLVAAPVLARGRRAVVVGDPRQLRHVSFVADLDVDAALAEHDLDDRAGLLDVRRMSSFDVAAAAAPVRWLDVHLRSRPHLIRFSADRFYEDHLHLATAHPSVDGHDAIDTVHVAGTARDGVVAAEVEAVVAEVGRIAARTGTPTVGVVTPFRAQADALEEALSERVDADTMVRLRLRAGTVHGFQGGERDVVLVSLGLTDACPPQRRRFVEDPHLFNVMVTRARHRIVLVTSLAGGGGLTGDYLDHAERPPRDRRTVPPADAWTRALLGECRRNGLDARPGRGGDLGVHLVIGRGDEVVGVLTRPHERGLLADVERHAALRRAGWRLREEYATPTDADAVGRALRLRADLL